MPGTMEPHRAHAIKIALQEIDRHLGVYDTAEKRRAMLSRLIQEHDLKDSPQSERGKIIDMTEARYDHMVVKAMTDNARYLEQQGLYNKWKGGIQEVVQIGSKNVSRKFLQTIGFQTQDDDDVTGAEEDTLALATSPANAETQQATPKREATQGPERVPSPATSTSSWKPNADGNGDSDHEDSRKSPRKKQKTSKEASSAVAPSTVFHSAATPKSAASRSDEAQRQSPARENPGIVMLKVGIPKSVSASHTSPHGSGLVKLGAQSIQNEMSGIWYTIQNLTRNMLGDNAEGRAAWVMEPNKDLLKLYKRLFSEDWKGRVCIAHRYRPVQRKQVLDACLAAAIYEFIFMKPPPWDGPKEMLRSLGEDVAIIDRVLQGTGCKRTLEHILWQAARTKLEYENGDEFRSGKLREVAIDLAKTIFIVLNDQLVNLEAGDTGLLSDVVNVVSDALLLRGRLRAAPDHYKVQWDTSGSLFNHEDSEEIHESQGKQEVLWCVSPRVKTRASGDTEWSVAVRAKVYTRPWPKGKQ
ncbi:hypothetical protein LTR97_004451 [Elasticomyces elasticus]|uniref:Uncharacterized protein n=1 Tax=Elasticomyces elasticus TaxID=574655 RepID=A0AAN8A2A4_9PEZI|nr:hypothetical protein LTR97_004451 [Elasticomyces elasticus]